MLDVTDRHFNYVARLLSASTTLYSEMFVARSLIYGNPERLISQGSVSGPVALQLATDNPSELAEAIRIAAPFCYNEINLNIGCPSDRVQSGNFGACLMNDPALVAELVTAALEVTTLPVTVKHRTGVDHNDSPGALLQFAHTVTNAGAKRLVIHARKAWLKGLSPKQNRSVPPLQYELVHAVKHELPHQQVELNGGLTSVAHARAAAAGLDGAMIGRAVASNPFVLLDIDQPALTGTELLQQLHLYLQTEVAAGTPLIAVTRRYIPLFAGWPGARAWRRTLTEASQHHHNPATLVHAAAEHLPSEWLHQPLVTAGVNTLAQ